MILAIWLLVALAPAARGQVEVNMSPEAEKKAEVARAAFVRPSVIPAGELDAEGDTCWTVVSTWPSRICALRYNTCSGGLFQSQNCKLCSRGELHFG
jgi:hypothetical protein